MSSNDRNRFEQAINIVSTRIKLILLQIEASQTDKIQEVRLRAEKPVIVVNEAGCFFLTDKGKITKIYTDGCIIATVQEISDTLNRACKYSIHSFQQSINNGYITINGGHRIGVAGTCVAAQNGDLNVRDISCINIRIARQVFGVSEIITEHLMKNEIKSIIVAGPPSSGKTTFLRDFAYRISSGITGDIIKTVVLDERGELSAPYAGVGQNNLGMNTDILINYKKSVGVEISLRSLSPEYIIFDEICSSEDLNAIKTGLNSGVKFAVSVHTGNEDELKEKQLVKHLLETRSFSYIILLSRIPFPGTVKKVFKTIITDNEIIWSDISSSVLGAYGYNDKNKYEKENTVSEQAAVAY